MLDPQKNTEIDLTRRGDDEGHDEVVVTCLGNCTAAVTFQILTRARIPAARAACEPIIWPYAKSRQLNGAQ